VTKRLARTAVYHQRADCAVLLLRWYSQGRAVEHMLDKASSSVRHGCIRKTFGLLRRDLERNQIRDRSVRCGYHTHYLPAAVRATKMTHNARMHTQKIKDQRGKEEKQRSKREKSRDCVDCVLD